MEKDYLLKAVAFDGEIRVYVARTTKMVEHAQKLTNSYPSASAAFGRTLTVASMMGAMLKGDDNLTIRIDGKGPINGILVNANANGNVKGYIGNPGVHFQYNTGKLNVGMTVGNDGFINVTKDLAIGGMYTSTSKLVSGEIGDDFAYYFTQSEQVPSTVAVGVLVNTDNTIMSAGGYIVQAMPNITEETLVKVEEAIGKMAPVSELINNGETPESILKMICGDNDCKILDKQEVKYHCDCSKDKFKRGLISLGKDELDQAFDESENGLIETSCHFCNNKYQFDRTEF